MGEESVKKSRAARRDNNGSTTSSSSSAAAAVLPTVVCTTNSPHSNNIELGLIVSLLIMAVYVFGFYEESLIRVFPDCV